MSSRGVKQSAQLPAAPVDATPPARVGKRGALSVPRSGEGSNAVPASVRSIKFEAQGGAKAPIEFVEGGPMRPLPRSRDARMTTAVSSSEEDEELQAILAAKAPIEFVEGGPMRPFRQSCAPRLTAAVCTSDEEEQDTGQFTSPFLLLLSVLIPLNYFRQKFHCANSMILILPLIGSRDRSGEL